MPIASTTYEPTKLNAPFAEPMKPKLGYQISNEEKKTLEFVLKRFTDMKSARSRIDLDWQTWIRIAESKFYPYADGRTRVNVPLLRALKELFVAEATARRIDKEIEPVGLSDIDKAEVMKEVWDYDWNRNKRDEQMTDAEYKVADIGTACYMTGFEQTDRIINDPDVNEDRLITYTRKLMRKGNIILRTVDIRNVYFDDRVTCFDDCDDQIYLEYITPEQFQQEKGNPNYKNMEYVGTTSKTDQVYYTFEDLGKQNTGLIEKMHYWSVLSDKYIVIYNRQVVARDDPSPYAHKLLPIVPRQYGKVVDSIYGRGLSEACMQFLDKINRLSEMLFDGLSRSNNSIFALGNGLTFDSNKFSFNNQVLKFNGQLDDAHFREIKGIPPNQAAFTYLQDLMKEIAVYVGIDPAQIIGQASSTAFETAVRAESSLKRVNVVLSNRDYALQKVFQRHLANIMQFFPLSEAESIAEVSASGEVKARKDKTSYPKMLLDGKKFVPETGKLVEEPGKFEFEVKPEYIRGQMDITVKTNFNAPTLKSLKQESMKEFLNAYTQYSQMSVADPNLAKMLPPDDFIKELAFTYDIDLSAIGGFSDSISKQWDELMAKVQESAGNVPVPPEGQGMPGAPALPQEGQQQGMGMLPNVEAKGLPNVNTPKTPGIGNLSPAETALI